MKRGALILAGGAGTRLWPLSTEERPKQFLAIIGQRSLLQCTVTRLEDLVSLDDLFVSTNDKYRDLVREQLPELPEANILVEPSRRNTGPAVATSCAVMHRSRGELTIGVFHADHAVADEPAFVEVARRAYAHAEGSDDLVTIAITPTEPNTGFGYLELGAVIAPDVVRVERFVEKPSRERAEQFVLSGRFGWNAGMFVWRSRLFFDVLQTVAPDIARLAHAFAVAAPPDRTQIYDEMPSISIDYAVMEKAPRVAAVRGDFGWDDVGSWSAVARLNRDAAAPNLTIDSASNVYSAGTSSRPVVVIGVDNVAVIESEEGILVVSLDKAERLSSIVKELKR